MFCATCGVTPRVELTQFSGTVAIKDTAVSFEYGYDDSLQNLERHEPFGKPLSDLRVSVLLSVPKCIAQPLLTIVIDYLVAVATKS